MSTPGTAHRGPVPIAPQAPYIEHPSAYRPDIDGLRAVAVIAVVVFHAFPRTLPGGFIGVDIFFVISGFLISTIILRALEAGRFSIIDFYIRRIRRIFPALTVVLTACLAFGWFALFADEYEQLGKHALGGVAFVSNFVLLNESGYFDNSSYTKPLLHLWSLGVEEQFYLVWPLLLWLGHRSGLHPVISIVGIAAVSFYLNIASFPHDAVSAFYLPQTRFWELLAGALLAYVLMPSSTGRTTRFPTSNSLGAFHARLSTPRARDAAAITGVVLLVAGFFLIRKTTPFPGYWAILPVAGASLLILAGPGTALNRNLLSNRLMVGIGLISYPLYLWHWPLLSFAQVIESEVPARSVRLAAIGAAVLLAWATYRFIERPLRFGRHGGLKVTALLSAMLPIALFGVHLLRSDGLPSRGLGDRGPIQSQLAGPAWKHALNRDCLDRYALDGWEKWKWWFCAASNRNKPTLLILGNSYANHFYPGAAFNSQLSHHTVLSVGACDPHWWDKSPPPDAEASKTPCSKLGNYKQFQLINGILEREGSVRYVIVGGLNPLANAEYIASITERLGRLMDSGLRVIVFTPHLTPSYDIKGCFGRPFAPTVQDCKASVEERRKLLASFEPLRQSLAARHPGMLFFDTNELFCADEKECSFKIDGLPVFRDEYNHLSEFGATRLFEHFAEWAKVHVPDILAPQPKRSPATKID